MSVSVIVVSYRTGPSLNACLESIGRAAGVDDIVIVDNGNDPPEAATIDAFAAADARASVQRGQGNVGFAAACNLAARQARGETFVFVNPDVILGSDAVEKLVAALKTAPPPAIIGGDLRDARGRPERGSRRERLTLWRAFVYASGIARAESVLPFLRDFNRHRDPLPKAPVRVGAVSGALLVLRRADYESLGGFDDGYFLHVEDIDLCRRAEERGWPVLFAPGPHGVHVRSTSAADARVVARHKARGMARYLNKFARGPVERVASQFAGGVLTLLSR